MLIEMNNSIQYRNTFSMGTRLDVVLPGITDDIADAVCMQIKGELTRIEEKISIYNESSAFSLLNRNASVKPVKTDKEVFSLVNRLVNLSENTWGYFDFAMGMLPDLKNKSSDDTLQAEALQKLVHSMGVKNIVVDQEELSVYFKTDTLKIDSGGFGKGYGLDCVKKILDAWKIDSAFISFGESSILAYGNHPFGKAWQAGIQNIFEQSDSLFAFDLYNGALSVSGINPQNIKKYGGGHIVDPHTGVAVDAFRQTAVAGSSGLIAEVVSTALLCAPDDIRLPIMEQFPDYRAIVVDYDQSNKPSITFTFNTDDGRTN